MSLAGRLLVWLLIATCGCSFKATREDNAEAKAEGSSKEKEEHAPTTVVEIGPWDELVFVDDGREAGRQLPAPDAGLQRALEAAGADRVAGGAEAPQRPVVRHHPAVRITTIGAWSREREDWLASSFDGESSLDSNFDFMGSPLKWVGAGGVLLVLLLVLYKLRRKIPWLSWVP